MIGNRRNGSYPGTELDQIEERNPELHREASIEVRREEEGRKFEKNGETDLRWQERLSEHDSGRGRNPRNAQYWSEPPLHDSQNGFLGPRTLNDGAVRQEHGDLNRGDDE